MRVHLAPEVAEQFRLLAPATTDDEFSRALLAIDFGPASLGAARWATTHVTRGADAILAHVIPCADGPAGAEVPSGADRASLHRMTPALVGGLGGFAATLDVAAYRSVVRVGPPSRCLAAVADDLGAALLVLGRRSDANRTRIGEPNVIERTARRAASSVLVVPEGTTGEPEHIVVAVDESRFAPRALRIASRLARMHEIPLTVLHVLPPPVGSYERLIRSTKHVVAGARGKKEKPPQQMAVPQSLASSTARWLAHLSRSHNAGGQDVTEVAVGDPAREIVRTAMERGTSLVVVGMRGADEAPSGSIGSVARELLTRGPMPVLALNAA
jgi:nucleotide-binding universal stress UspA family protein